MSTTSFNDLPQETAACILLRLSVKDLIRSTSNKTWYSLITNPSFISDQIRNAISSCHDNALLIIPSLTSHQNYCSLISAHTSSVLAKFDIPFDTKTRSLKLVTQIHGMLLLTDMDVRQGSRQLYLWNPYVKRHRVLFSSCFKKYLDDADRTHCVTGMGFDKGTSDYKVVRIVYVGDKGQNLCGEVAPKVEVYSFRKNTWRRLKNHGVRRLVDGYGAYVDGSFYWVERMEPKSIFTTLKSKNLRILSFDFESEVFEEVRLPVGVPDCLGTITPFQLMEFEGLLAFCVLDTFDSSDEDLTYPYCMWLMRQENGVRSWTLRFRTVLKEGGTPVNITKNGTLVIEIFRMGSPDITNLVSYNLKSMIRKYHGYGKPGGQEVINSALSHSTVDTSFPESLIMFEGGKSLVKSAK
ncbi:hypothetical protein AgCh_001778 [Apium graveolens]